MNKICFVGFFIFVLASTNVFAQVPADLKLTPSVVTLETKELVRRLLEANGTRESLIAIFEDIIKRAPVESQKELRSLLKPDAIIDNIVPIYAKYFTDQELKELIVFYKSPVGAKNLALTPRLMTEVMEASAQYFENNTKSLKKPSNVKTHP